MTCKSQILLCRASLHPAWTNPAVSGSGRLRYTRNGVCGSGCTSVRAKADGGTMSPCNCPKPWVKVALFGLGWRRFAALGVSTTSICFQSACQLVLLSTRPPQPPDPLSSGSPQSGQAESPCRSRAPCKSPGSASPGACFSSRRHQKK